jgi:type IV secretion system protein VirB9
MKRVLVAAALLALSAPALADDPRLVERVYDPARVVTIEGKASVQATIRFADGEHIENVAIGDSTKWQVTPNRRANILFVKPLADRATTNMTVVTDRYTYLFDLVASPAHRNPLYVLSFSYPEALEEARLADARTAPVEAPTELELAAATDPYAVHDPAALNYAWSTRGDGRLLPALVYDDGEATFLTWAPGAPIPAILVKDHQGTEGPVNFAVRGDVIVVDGVPREIVLRAGKDNATLINNGQAREPRTRRLAQATEVNP